MTRGALLLIPSYAASLSSTLLPLARLARERGVRVIAYLPEHLPDAPQCAEALRRADIPLFTHAEALAAKPRNPALPHLVDGPRRMRAFLRREGVGALLTVTNSPLFLIRAARSLDLPVVGIQWAHTIGKDYYDGLRRRDIQRAYAAKVGTRLAPAAVRLNRAWRQVLKVPYGLLGYRLHDHLAGGMATAYCVMGPHYADLFRSQGTPASRLQITGHPEHDRLHLLAAQRDAAFVAQTRREAGLDPDRRLLLVGREAVRFFDLVPEEDDREGMRMLARVLCARSGDQVALKPHPRDDPATYDFLREEFPQVRLLPRDADLQRLIASSDVYLSQVSSTLNWALALDVPAVSYAFRRWKGGEQLRDRPGIAQADSPAALADLLERILDKGDTQARERAREARERFMVLDGRACERILALAGV